MELSHIIAAEKIIKDAVSSKHTLIDVFTIIHIPKQTPNPPRFFALYGRILSIQEGHANIELLIQHEGGNIVDQTLMEGDVKEGDLDFTAYFGPTTFDKKGKYYFRVKYNGEPLLDNDKYYVTAKELDEHI